MASLAVAGLPAVAGASLAAAGPPLAAGLLAVVAAPPTAADLPVVAAASLVAAGPPAVAGLPAVVTAFPAVAGPPVVVEPLLVVCPTGRAIAESGRIACPHSGLLSAPAQDSGSTDGKAWGCMTCHNSDQGFGSGSDGSGLCSMSVSLDCHRSLTALSCHDGAASQRIVMSDAGQGFCGGWGSSIGSGASGFSKSGGDLDYPGLNSSQGFSSSLDWRSAQVV